jgi:hypothetical protein
MNSVVLLLYLVPILLLGYWLLRRGRRPPPLPDAAARVLAVLKRRGADLTKPTTVTTLLTFESRVAAEAAARDIPPTWATEIQEIPAQHRWVLKAARRMVPVPAELSTQAQELEATAMRHGGEYEGLEADG